MPFRVTAELDTWTVYKHPDDYPTKWVVRRWSIKAGYEVPQEAYSFDTLEQARQRIPAGLFRIPRCDADPRAVFETWI